LQRRADRAIITLHLGRPDPCSNNPETGSRPGFAPETS
jgi:hypothetical protein